MRMVWHPYEETSTPSLYKFLLGVCARCLAANLYFVDLD